MGWLSLNHCGHRGISWLCVHFIDLKITAATISYVSRHDQISGSVFFFFLGLVAYVFHFSRAALCSWGLQRFEMLAGRAEYASKHWLADRNIKVMTDDE